MKQKCILNKNIAFLDEILRINVKIYENKSTK